MNPKINHKKFAKDYNKLIVGEYMAFLMAGKTAPESLARYLTRNKLKRRTDFILRYQFILHPQSIPFIAGFPRNEIPEREFISYACLEGSPFSDPGLHPNIYAADLAIPRRSNRNLTSDSLPIIADTLQVYVRKLTSKKLRVKG